MLNIKLIRNQTASFMTTVNKLIWDEPGGPCTHFFFF